MLGRYLPPQLEQRVRDSLLYLVIAGLLSLVSVGAYHGGVHLTELTPEKVTLEEVPWALTLSVVRMAASYVAALFFSFILGILAARTLWGERIIIPLLDVLQSIPIVGFFPAAISFFIALTQGHRLGVELAACFLIFTSMAWNMAFAIYESVKAIPQEKTDAINSFGVRGSQVFWKLYGPICMPRLVYNSILSWSNGWFFLVACEIIAVGPIQYHLPGIGSFIARAAEQDEIGLVLWGLLALTIFILVLDFVLWRPLSNWSEKFRQDEASTESEAPTFETLTDRFLEFVEPVVEPTKALLIAMTYPVRWLLENILSPLLWDLPAAVLGGMLKDFNRTLEREARLAQFMSALPVALFFFAMGYVIWEVSVYFRPPYPPMVWEIPMALLVSTGRLVIALLISLAWVLPVVLLTWYNPRTRRLLTTVAQVGASLPAIALFPFIFLLAVKRFGGGMEIASILLLLTGMQWYLLFNCIGGTANIPNDLIEAARSFGLPRRQIWKRLVIPAIRPSMITGALTAWGGGWNALVVAEYVRYKDEVMTVRGIGALLNTSVFESGNTQAIVLCLTAMVGWIVLLNLIFWRPMLQLSIKKFRFEG